MTRIVEFVKQYPGPEQVDLCVEIEVPGSWFGGTLNATERSLKYKAQAVEYDDVREFPDLSPKSRKTKEKAIRFLCIVDAAVDPNSDCYWMKLSQWNRFRHDTFKERRDEELPFILKAAVATVVNTAGMPLRRMGRRIPRSNTSVHGCGYLRPRPLLGGTEECPSGALLALVGGGGLREGGQRQR
jgi:hypothetical protein